VQQQLLLQAQQQEREDEREELADHAPADSDDRRGCGVRVV
jgi:hypothetical protein